MTENEQLRSMLRDCAKVIKVLLDDGGRSWLGENAEIEQALEAAGLVYWSTMKKGDELEFEGAEDMEPGDAYWMASKRWGEIVAASKVSHDV